MKSMLFTVILSLSFGLAYAGGPGPAESGRIESLITAVENLQGAVFIRNGTEHNPHEAADHLRLKLHNAGRRVRTAEDFITYCATRSSFSGKPYQIRFGDGTVIATGTFLREKLLVLKNGNSGQAAEGKL